MYCKLATICCQHLNIVFFNLRGYILLIRLCRKKIKKKTNIYYNTINVMN